MNEEKKNLFQRILAIMGEVKYIQKESKKVNNQYSYVAHDAVTAALHDPLVEHGVLVVPSVEELKQDGNRTSVKLSVTFVNADDAEEQINIMSWGYGIDSQDKGVGKAISYAYKYALLKMFCLETGDDPERDKEEYAPGFLNEDQVMTLEHYIAGDDNLTQRCLRFTGAKSLDQITTDKYEAVLANVKKYSSVS